MPRFRDWDGNPSDIQDHRQYPTGTVPVPTAPAAPPPDAPAPDFGTFQLPSYHGASSPTFNMPNAPNFSFEDFRAPSFQDAQNEPGYQFALDQGTKALNASAAARGVLRTGGTLKDIIEYGNKFGEQNYGNVYNRAKQTYDTRLGLAKDKFAPQFAQYQNAAQAEQARALAAFNRDYEVYNSQLQGQLSLEQLINQNLQFGAPSFPSGG